MDKKYAMSNSAEFSSLQPTITDSVPLFDDWINPQHSLSGFNDTVMGGAHPPANSGGQPSPPVSVQTGSRRQGRWWILTVPELHFQLPAELPDGIAYVKGQLEVGEGGFRHWQLFAISTRKCSLASIKRVFGQQCHAELTRSDAAEEYVWKEDTRVAGSQFELGSRPHRRNAATDWQNVWDLAVGGNLLDIEHAIRVQHYRTLRQIGADFAEPLAFERKCFVFCGPTGTGKSRRAWREASVLAYPKDPRTKFWCGYRDQKNVVIDEFRGGIDIAHLLRWLDRYPVIVEVKGSSTCLVAQNIWITSNKHPREWYPELDELTYQALERRLEIIEMNSLEIE